MNGDPFYLALTESEEAELKKIYAVHLDEDWFFILDALWEFRTFINDYTLAENNYLHDWKVGSIQSVQERGCLCACYSYSNFCDSNT